MQLISGEGTGLESVKDCELLKVISLGRMRVRSPLYDHG